MTNRNSWMVQIQEERGMYNPEKAMPRNESVVSVLNDFVQAVNEMDQTVLVPSRLKDVEDSTDIVMTPTLPLSPPCTPPETPSPRLSATNLTELPQVNCCQTDLYKRFNMLQGIKRHLLKGEDKSHDRLEGDDEDDHSTFQIEDGSAAALKYHLDEVFHILKQLTQSANTVTSAYQNNVGPLSSPNCLQQSFM